jgi:hypothetical protein
MTAVAPPAPLIPIRRAVRWDQVEAGFRVGTRDGEYIGFIETTPDGTFVAVDGRSTPVGRFYSLKEAQRALTEVERMGSPRGRAVEDVARRLATASGLVAATMMVSAGAMFLAA